MSAPPCHFRPPSGVVFDGDLPVSTKYEDSYFSQHGGLAESRAVFLDGIDAPDIWRDRPAFTIGELGFGTGLNFLATWAAWRATPGPAPLHYVGVEGFPLRRPDMARALSAFPELAELAQALCEALPPPLIGAHRLCFDGGRVQLTLLFDDALAALDGYEMQADAWFLDGFAPDRNPGMWQPALLRAVARLSRPGARIATYSAAGDVRRALAEAGFAVDRRPGFAGKRHRLAGYLADPPPPRRGKRPWFDLPPARSGPVAVIGGGIAGCMAAQACFRAGLETTLIAPEPADRLPAALLAPRPDMGANAPARLSLLASLHAWRCYDDMEPPVWLGPRGLVQPLQMSAETVRAERLIDALGLPEDLLRPVDADELAALAGLPLDCPGLLWPRAGCVDPAAIDRATGAPIRRIARRVVALDPVAGGWALRDNDRTLLAEVSTVIVAMGTDTVGLLGAHAPPMRRQPGRVALLEAGDAPTRAVSWGGFLTPALPLEAGAARILGGSFGADKVAAADYAAMRTAARRTLGEAAAALPSAPLSMWSGQRAETADHRPHAGPVIDPGLWRSAYGAACRGRRADLPPFPPVREGLYVLTGLGGRGFQWAPLMADSLAAQIAGQPQPIQRRQREAVHPGRMLIRQMASA